jgi:hypothetical protein
MFLVRRIQTQLSARKRLNTRSILLLLTYSIPKSFEGIQLFLDTILAKREVSIARILAMETKKFTIYGQHYISQPGIMNLPSGFHAA